MTADLNSIFVSAPVAALTTGSQQWKTFLTEVSCDLSSPGTPVRLAYATRPAVSEPQGIYKYGYVDTDSDTVIYLLEISLLRWLQAMYGVRDYGIEPSGVFDCQSAKAMVLYARWLQGIELADADAYKPGPVEAQHLLSSSEPLNLRVVEKARLTDSMVNAAYIAIPDEAYSAPPFQAGCGFVHGYEGTGGSTVWAPVPSDSQGMQLAGYSEGAEEGTNWLLWGGLALGAVGAFMFGSTLFGKKRG